VESCIQLWGPQYKTDMHMLVWVQRRTTEIIRGMEHFCYEDWLREPVQLQVVQLEDEKAPRRP